MYFSCSIELDPAPVSLLIIHKLYFSVLFSRSEALIDCPDIPLPVNGSGDISSMSCTCLGNSSALDGQSLERSCDQNGVCTEGQSCGCDAGLEFSSDLNTCVGRIHNEYSGTPKCRHPEIRKPLVI